MAKMSLKPPKMITIPPPPPKQKKKHLKSHKKKASKIPQKSIKWHKIYKMTKIPLNLKIIKLILKLLK